MASFQPSTECAAHAELSDAFSRSWIVPFWQLEVKWIFVALPFGIVRRRLANAADLASF